MSNNVTRNTSTKIAEAFIPGFEATATTVKTVTNDTISADFANAKYGDTTYVKRPHDYIAEETSGGDVSALPGNSIISATAPAVVQNYITVRIPWTNREEALSLNQLEQILKPAAERCNLQLEKRFNEYAVKNSGLHYGTVGAAIDSWSDIAVTGSLAQSIGVPMSGEFYNVVNPFAITNLAGAQNGIQNQELVKTSWQKARIDRNFAGITALTATTLTSVTLGAGAGAAGISVLSAPDQTYVTNKDAMIQTVTLTGFTASLANAIRPGDTIKVTQSGRSHLNVKTREIAVGPNGQPLAWHWKAVTGGNANASGQVTITVTNAAIFESGGQYNNISSAIQAGDTVSVLGTASAIVQPSLMYHKEAFGIGFVDLPKLNGWDSSVISGPNGERIRVTKYSDPLANTQGVRFDILPAFATFNPLYAGTFYG